MQSSGDSALALAVEGDVRTVVYSFEVDWNRNGLYSHALSDLTSVVQAITIDRDVNSSLPKETTMVEGFMAAQMVVTLGGTRPADTQPIARLLSSWNQASPLFGDGKLVVPVRASIGHRVVSGAETMVRQFTGTISNHQVNARNSEVQITCLDPAGQRRSSINLPLYALEDSGSGKPISDWRINSQWVIDYILRQNGIYMSPPPHATAIWSCTNHGATIPEIGWMAYYPASQGGSSVFRTQDDRTEYPGRPGWGLAVSGDNRGVGPIVYSRANGGVALKAGDSLTVQLQVDTTKIGHSYGNSTGKFLTYCTGPAPDHPDVGTSMLVFGISSAGQQFVEFRNNSGVFQTLFASTTMPLTGYTDVWYRVDMASPLSSSSVTFSHGGTSAVDLTALSSTNVWPFPSVGVIPIWPMHDIQVYNTTGTSAGASRYDPTTWVPQADLDAGLGLMTGLPLRRGVDSWDLIKEVVGAEYGVAGFDENGRFFFKNRDTLRRQGLSIDKTATNERIVTDLVLSERTGSVRNVITSVVTPRLIEPYNLPTSTGSIWGYVYNLKDPGTLVAGPGTSTFQIQLDSPSWTPDDGAAVSQLAADDFFPTPFNEGSSRFMAVRQGQTSVEQTGVIVTVTTLPPSYGLDQVFLQVYNPGVYPIIFATLTGEPALQLAGRKYSQDQDLGISIRRQSSVTRYGELPLELPNSDWRQHERSTGNISRSLLRDLQRPIPVIENLSIVGDCRLQLQDTLSTEDTHLLGGPVYTTVTGIRRSLTVSTGGAKLVDQLNVRPFAAPGKWILGHSQWGILGQTTKL